MSCCPQQLLQSRSVRTARLLLYSSLFPHYRSVQLNQSDRSDPKDLSHQCWLRCQQAPCNRSAPVALRHQCPLDLLLQALSVR